MPSNEYHFITRWHVEGTCAEVYDILDDPLQLPHWWPAVYLDVRELSPEPERGPEKVYELLTKGWLPYTLRWRLQRTAKNPPFGFTIAAWGDFVGRGEWTLTADGPVVDVTYDWRIRADKPVLRALSFVLKPIFSANHRWAMANGEESLKRELARRRARTPEERASVPGAPGPTWPHGRRP
jgi:hypothetical protein